MASGKNKSPISKFILEFSDLIERIFTLNVKIVLAGDFNVHVDIPSDSEAILFNDILTTFNLQQHVKGTTHRCGHTLDLVISDNNILSQTKVFSATSSDHSYINCEVFFPRPKLPKIQISSRNIKSIIINDFLTDLHFGSSYSDGDSALP